MLAVTSLRSGGRVSLFILDLCGPGTQISLAIRVESSSAHTMSHDKLLRKSRARSDDWYQTLKT